MNLLLWLESTALSTWLRESEALWALPGMLFLHTLAMGLLAGSCVVLCLRACGMVAELPFATLRGFKPVVRIALWVSIVSGVLLLIAYPTKALTNPVFYAKLAAIAFALAAWRSVARGVYASSAEPSAASLSRVRHRAGWSVLLWLAAIALGRLLAYTYRHMSASDL